MLQDAPLISLLVALTLWKPSPTATEQVLFWNFIGTLSGYQQRVPYWERGERCNQIMTHLSWCVGEEQVLQEPRTLASNPSPWASMMV